MNRQQMMPATFSGLIEDLFSSKPARFFRDDFIQDEWLKHTHRIPVNVKESDHNYLIEVVAPGIAKEDFQVKINNKTLTISFEQKEEKKEEGEKWLRKEFKARSFKRSFTLGEQVDADKISARYEQGMLLLAIPKKEDAVVTPKVIDIL